MRADNSGSIRRAVSLRTETGTKEGSSRISMCRLVERVRRVRYQLNGRLTQAAQRIRR